MSHFKERAEKTCLNCGAPLGGRYCHQCGQENIEPRMTLAQLILHFFSDLTHFDGKFFVSVRKLIGRPGFLPQEFSKGSRAAYLDPIRMYLFVSAVFFLIFYTFFTPKPSIGHATTQTEPATVAEALKKNAYKQARERKDSLAIDSGMAALEHLTIQKEVKLPSTAKDSNNAGESLMDLGQHWSSREQYDSAQRTLPDSLKESWLLRQLAYRRIALTGRYGTDQKLMLTALLNHFLHLFPYILFITLPLNAFFLKLLYFRRRDLFVSDHAIYLIYLYIFTFLFLLFFFAANALQDKLQWGLMNLGFFIYCCYGIYYSFRAMRVYYGQGKKKTLVKFLLLNLLAGTGFLILFILFLGISLFQF